MKRAIFAAVSTLAALYMMLTYRPETASSPLPVTQPTLTQAANTTSDVADSSVTTSRLSRPSSSTSSLGAPSTTRPSTTTTSAARTLNGPPVDTKYGPVQVSITVSNKRITAANALQYPRNNSRDEQINSRAIPILQSETLSAQSANIQNVSGATYTSEGWKTSLQSALTAAGM